MAPTDLLKIKKESYLGSTKALSATFQLHAKIFKTNIDEFDLLKICLINDQLFLN